MNISLFTIACVLYAIFLGATEANIDECTYIFLHEPVCGNDGKTYINSGHLTCEKLKKPGLLQLSEGECPKSGAIVQDGPLGDKGDGPKKIKIKIHKGHKHAGIKSKVTKQIIKAIKNGKASRHSGGKGRARGRRSAEENYEFNDYEVAYPANVGDEYYYSIEEEDPSAEE